MDWREILTMQREEDAEDKSGRASTGMVITERTGEAIFTASPI